jgi:hypothetical protein
MRIDRKRVKIPQFWSILETHRYVSPYKYTQYKISRQADDSQGQNYNQIDIVPVYPVLVAQAIRHPAHNEFI